MLQRILASAVLTAVCAMAQVPWPAQSVRFKVVAQDGKGAPVTDLTLDEIKLTDQGKPVPLTSFHKNASPKPAPLGPKEVSNKTTAPQTTVILLDLLNQAGPERVDAGRKLSKELSQIEHPESVYLYLLAMDGSLIDVHPLEADQAQRYADKDWTAKVDKELDKLMKKYNLSRPAGVTQEDAVKKSYLALYTLGNKMASWPGAHDILWVTSKVPNIWPTNSTCTGEWIDCALYVPFTARSLDRSATAIHPMPVVVGLPTQIMLDMEQMAGLTNGRPFFNTDFPKAVAELRADAANGYAVAWTPAGDNWDQKFHKVKVTTTRKDVKIISKTRYFAIADVADSPQREIQAMVAAWKDKNDSPDIGLRAVATPGAGSVKLTARVDVNDLQMMETPAGYEAQVTTIFSDFGPAGPLGNPAPVTLTLKLTKAQYETALKEGLPMDQDHKLEAGAERVKWILSDRGSRAVGSLTIPLK